MSMPGFTAEVSLSAANGPYRRGPAATDAAGGAVVPQFSPKLVSCTVLGAMALADPALLPVWFFYCAVAA